MKRLSRLAACLLALTLTACTAAETAVPAATAPPTAAPAPTAAPTAAPQATPLPYDDLSYVPEFGFQQKQTYQPDEYNRLYLDTYSFNDRTVLVGAEDETAALLEAGRDPGLGVRSLQARGITGQGVKIAIIDQSLLTDHPEISGAIAAYCETGIDSGLNEGTLHGPAVASILAGQTVGVAPGVQVYYMATPGAADSRPLADALRHILEINETLPEGEDGSGYDAQYWETAPSWAGEGHIQGSLLTVAELRELDVQAGEQVNEIKSVLGIQGDVTVKEDEENLDEVLAIYAVTHGQTENFPYGVKITGEQDRDELRSIYWCMTQITGVSNTKGAAIQVKHLDISEGAKVLELSGEQTAQAQGLLSSENKSEIAEMVEDSILNELTDSELAAVMSRIPEDISGERQAVLTAALSLEGKVKYFWGGKSSSVGWNPYWGESYTVTSPGSSQTGTTRTYGMDCSGFVSWAFINAEGSKEAASYIGEGSANQYRNSKAVDWKNAQPGDLVFYKNPAEGGINHVGIVVSVDENGPAAVVHCSSSKNGVVVTDASGFQHVRTPYIYGE